MQACKCYAPDCLIPAWLFAEWNNSKLRCITERKLKRNSVVLLLSDRITASISLSILFCTICSILYFDLNVLFYYYFNIRTWYYNLLIWSCFLFMNKFEIFHLRFEWVYYCMLCTLQMHNALTFCIRTDGLLLFILHRPHSRIDLKIKSNLQSMAPLQQFQILEHNCNIYCVISIHSRQPRATTILDRFTLSVFCFVESIIPIHLVVTEKFTDPTDKSRTTTNDE